MKEELRLNNSQLKVMQLVWESEPTPAKELTILAAERYGWNKNTTYTVLKSLVEKGAVTRADPDFICASAITLEQMRQSETNGLIEKLFRGSRADFLCVFLEQEAFDPDLRRLVNSPPVVKVEPYLGPGPSTGKPVIYLYPEETTDVRVTLEFDGELTYTYPAYRNGWRVTAQSDGTLTDIVDGSTHYYLFWEGIARDEWEHDRGASRLCCCGMGRDRGLFLRRGVSKPQKTGVLSPMLAEGGRLFSIFFAVLGILFLGRLFFRNKKRTARRSFLRESFNISQSY